MEDAERLEALALAEMEAANEPQWVVWLDAAGEAEWAAAELMAYGGPAARRAEPHAT